MTIEGHFAFSELEQDKKTTTNQQNESSKGLERFAKLLNLTAFLVSSTSMKLVLFKSIISID